MKRYKIATPPKGEPKPACPWCGSTHYPQHYGLRNGRPTAWGFRVNKRKVTIHHSIKSPRRYALDFRGRPFMRGAASRTTAVCAHPFHEQFTYVQPEDVIPERVIPPRVHNPDLAEMKRSMKRQLQGKDRR